MFVAIDTPTVFKGKSFFNTNNHQLLMHLVRLNLVLASGIEAPFAVGDIVSVTGCAPAGINTTSASLLQQLQDQIHLEIWN